MLFTNRQNCACSYAAKCNSAVVDSSAYPAHKRECWYRPPPTGLPSFDEYRQCSLNLLVESCVFRLACPAQRHALHSETNSSGFAGHVDACQPQERVLLEQYTYDGEAGIRTTPSTEKLTYPHYAPAPLHKRAPRHCRLGWSVQPRNRLA